MAAAKKRERDRTTEGPHYSGKHTGLRRPLTQTIEDFDLQDALAADAGMTWAQWARAQLKLGVSRAQRRAG